MSDFLLSGEVIAGAFVRRSIKRIPAESVFLKRVIRQRYR